MTFGKIEKMIDDKNIGPKDCVYHTLRTLENGGKIKALVIKEEPNVVHVEYICPFCGHYDYTTQEYVKVSKTAAVRFRVECSKCKKKIKIEKLKSKKKKKKE